jgi:GNAT superfamily N-acetyltransferase
MGSRNSGGRLPIQVLAAGMNGQVLDHHDEFDLDFHRAYAEVLEPAFPADELESEESLRSALAENDRDPQTLALVVIEPDGVSRGDPVGIVVGEWYRASGVLLIVYVAVRADRRGTGLGKSLMRVALERWLHITGCGLALGEVEDPRHFNEQEAIQRLRFHGRVGGSLLSIPYFQPRLRPDSHRVHHMLLVVFAAADAAKREGGVDGAVLRAFLEQYVAVTEGEEAIRSDPGIAWLLRFYEADVVPLVPMTRFSDIPDPDPPTEP